MACRPEYVDWLRVQALADKIPLSDVEVAKQYENDSIYIILNIYMIYTVGAPSRLSLWPIHPDKHTCQVLDGTMRRRALHPIDFWVTVPAICSENTKTLMQQGVTNAGFDLRLQDQVLTISEPETAANTVINHSVRMIWRLVGRRGLYGFTQLIRLFRLVMDCSSVIADEARW